MKKEGYATIILPDGSKGPKCEAKMGVAMLAKMTQVAIIPMSSSADRYWRIPSWDRIIIFYIIQNIFGPPKYHYFIIELI